MHHSRKTGFVALLCTAMVAAFSFFACSSGGGGGDKPATETYTLKITQPAVADGTITVEPKKSAYDKNDTVLVTATPATGKAFSGWTGDFAGSTNPAVITMDSSKTISASFVSGFSITAAPNTNDGGCVTVDPAKAVYTSGESVKITATPKDGYEFSGWTGDLSGTTNPATITVTKSLSATALFSLKAAPKHHLTIEITPSDSGTVSLASGDYAEGMVLPVDATAKHGYSFNNFTAGTWSSTSKHSSYTMPTTDATLTAIFDALPERAVTFAANPVDGGTVSIEPSSGPYYDGDIVRFTATAASLYEFDHWSGSSTSSNKIDTVTLNGDVSMTANFKVMPVLTLSCSGGVDPTIGVSPSGTAVSTGKTALPSGSTVRLTAPKVAGYTFYCWKQGSSVLGYDAAYNFIINNDIALTAEYVKNTWTIMVYMDGDNNLEPNAIQDLNEMESVDLRGSGISVITLLDRSASYDTSNGNWSSTRLIPIKYDSNGVDNTIISSSIVSSDLELTANGNQELNMADPNTVTKFIAAGKEYASAENYMFIFWDHGSGWRSANMRTASRSASFIPGSISSSPLFLSNGVSSVTRTATPRADGFRAVCVDDTSGGDMLYTKEIGTALSGKGISVLGFDLCLTGMLEVAYEVRNCANYMIASPEVTPGDGWEYDQWLASFKAKTTKSGLELCKSVVDAFGTAYGTVNPIPGTCLAAYDLRKTDALVSAFSDVAQSACDYIKNGSDAATRLSNCNAVGTALGKTEDYYSVPGDWNVDVGNLVSSLQAYASAAVPVAKLDSLTAAVTNLVVYKWYNPTTGLSGNPNGTGIAVHFCSLGDDGNPSGINYAYFRDHTAIAPTVTNVPSFVDDSVSQYWCPNYSTSPKGGLLGLLFCEKALYPAQ